MVLKILLVAFVVAGICNANSIDATLDQVFEKLESLQNEVTELREKNTLLEAKLNKKLGNDQVGFFAYASVDYPAVVAGGTIPFPNTTFNLGNHYSMVTSKFVCPVNGMYYFSTSILAEHSAAEFDIVVGGAYLNIKSFAHDNVNWASASVSSVVPCNAEQEVEIRSTHSGWIVGGGRSSFTGFLLSFTPLHVV